MAVESIGAPEADSSAPLWAVVIDGKTASSGHILISAAGTLNINFPEGGGGDTLQVIHNGSLIQNVVLGTSVPVEVYPGYAIAYSASEGAANPMIFEYSLQVSS